METINIIKDGLEDISLREIYYFGPRMVTCNEKKVVSHKNYTFEFYDYNINSNGVKYVKIFDSDENEVLENLSISLGYNWTSGYRIEFSNYENQQSNCYFHFDGKVDLKLEGVLDRLVLIAEKNKKREKEFISLQYVYAYIVYIFFELKNEFIFASEFSKKYKTLKKMEALISKQLSDNVNNSSFSKDTVYYKVFESFINSKLVEFKGKNIRYD